MSGIKVSLKGFDDMLDKINKANGDVNKAAEKAINDSARIAEQELKSAAISAGLKSNLVSKIKTRKTAKGNTYAAKVGWELGAYNPNDLSAGYKAMFINYGTVRRKTKTGADRGALTKPPKQRQFIAVAKKKANKRIKQAQQQVIEKVARDIK